MRKILNQVPIALLLIALFFYGCTGAPSAAKASRLAVARSNEEAKRLYQVEPFKLEHGELRTERDRAVWEALASAGGHNLAAKVTFDEKGSVFSVDVRMLAHPTSEPVTNFDNLLAPDMQRNKRHTIPEVMPK